MPNPSYGFFGRYPDAEAFLARYEGREARIVLGLRPDVFEKIAVEAGVLIARLELESVTDHELVLKFNTSGRFSIYPTKEYDHETITHYESTIQLRHFPEAAARLRPFGRHAVAWRVEGRRLILATPHNTRPPLQRVGLVRSELIPAAVVSEDRQAVRLEPVGTRTLLLEGRSGEIITYALPRRIAEAIEELAAPYRS